MSNLFDENALEQQEPLRRHSRHNDDDDDASGSGNASEDDIDYDAVEVGDFVTFQNLPAGDAPIYGVVMPPEDIYIAPQRHPSTYGSAGEWVPVWLVIPTHCGDPQHLFQYIREDDLKVVDRPLDLNTVVVDRETLQFGIVCNQRVTFAATKLEQLLTYHRIHRYGGFPRPLTRGLCQPPKPSANVSRQPWYLAAQDHVKKLSRDVPELQSTTYDGHYFVRANPFFIGQHVRSVKRCVTNAMAEVPSDVSPASPNDIVAPSTIASDVTNEIVNSNSTNDDEELVHFSGHVRAVSYSALVELMIPPPMEGRAKGQAGDSSSQFLVILPPTVIETTIQKEFPERQVLFRNVRNMFRLDAATRGDYVETDDDATVAPSQMDLVAPLMYVENMSMDLLENTALWVRGTFAEYSQLLDERCPVVNNNGSSAGGGKRPQKVKGRHRKEKSSATEAVDTSPNEQCGNGIVVFGFPDVITAIDFRTSLPRDFCAYELVAAETSGADNAFAGQHGFALPPEHPLFARASNTVDPPTGLAAVNVITPTLDMLAWYREHGILTETLESQQDWSTRLTKLYTALDHLVWITSSQSRLNVCWKESGEVSALDSNLVAAGDRSYRAVRDVFPMDVVLPQPVYSASHNLADLAAAAATSHSGAVSPRHLLSDPVCPVHDLRMLFEYGTDFQPGESVVARTNKERFIVEGEELTYDPTIIGRVVSANTQDETCSVMWYFQPDLTDAELVNRRPHDVGQVVELLPDTYVRVLWADGTVEDLPRVMLEPVRAADIDRDDGGEEEEDDDEEGEEDEPHTPEPINRGPDEAVSPPPSTDEVDPSDAPPSESWIQRLKRSVAGLIASSSIPHAEGDSSVGDDDDAAPTTHVDPEAPLDAAPESAPTTKTVACEVVSVFSKHIFQQEDGTEPRQHGPIFLKRIQHEWKDMVARIEQANLSAEASLTGGAGSTSHTMLVKSCSSSPELIKFVIIGPLHTPYYQSFLAFDLYYPATFPMEPPSVRFHAHNMRLNPNLYVDGYICLSLLGTWESSNSTETWRPATSSVMQILLSLQSLVLIKEPYYNEAGYDEYRGTPMGRSHSKTYNENLALLRIQHLIAMAESPPADWVFVFRSHFLQTAPLICARLTKLADQQEAAKSSHGDDDVSAVDNASSAPSEGITADGLVLPLSKGFIHSLRRHVKHLSDCVASFKQKWAEEEEAVLSLGGHE